MFYFKGVLLLWFAASVKATVCVGGFNESETGCRQLQVSDTMYRPCVVQEAKCLQMCLNNDNFQSRIFDSTAIHPDSLPNSALNFMGGPIYYVWNTSVFPDSTRLEETSPPNFFTSFLFHTQDIPCSAFSGHRPWRVAASISLLHGTRLYTEVFSVIKPYLLTRPVPSLLILKFRTVLVVVGLGRPQTPFPLSCC